ncbi:MAG: hypothetical protein REI09_10080 [Candidatus Dactylopiibacterium sp.]|nr:hypothetical protein [Candidatus Dactylopiibacterium sp.]
MTMLDSFNVSVLPIKGTFYFVPRSDTPDGYATSEMPPEECALDAANEVLGRAILRAAERCRTAQKLEDLGGTNANEVAIFLGFKSDRDLNRKVAPAEVLRRGGSASLIVRPIRPENGVGYFTSDKFEPPIDDPAELGRVVKLAVAISEANLLSMLEKRAKRTKK